MGKRKEAVVIEISKPGGAYCCVGCSLGFNEVGFVTRWRDLQAHIAAYATKHNVNKVKVLTGRNIMNVDGPSATFTVTVKVM